MNIDVTVSARLVCLSPYTGSCVYLLFFTLAAKPVMFAYS